MIASLVRFSRLVLLLLALLAAVSGSVLAEQIGQYTSIGCPEELADIEGLECGEVTVPLYHEDPARGTIRLGVFRLPALGERPTADPLVFLQGGPGGSVDVLIFISSGLNSLRAARDFVYIEQRGNRYSTPALNCPAYSRIMAEASQAVDVEAFRAFESEATRICLEEFNAAGVDLAAFDSYENARDIPMVVLDGLGYETYNLYGISYGSLLAQHVMEVAPRGLRSVILDAVVPRGIDFNEQVANFGWRSFSLLAAACAADDTCNSQAPNLENTLLSLIERLDAAPADITITNPSTGETFAIKLNGSRLATAIFSEMYASAGLRRLPNNLTKAAQDGSFEWAAQTLSQLLDSNATSMGMNIAVNCSERDYVEAEAPVDPNVPAVFAQALLAESTDMVVICSLVNVPRLPEDAANPASAPIPTLLLSGNFDPITPPAYGERVLQTLPQALHVTFPGLSHGVLVSGDACAQAISQAFLETTRTDLDLSCVSDTGLRFLRAINLTEYRVGDATFLGPDGWLKLEENAYTDLENSFLLVEKTEGRSLSANLEEFLSQVSEGLSSGDTEIIFQDRLPVGSFEWEVVLVNINTAEISLILAGTESATDTYLIFLQTTLGDAEMFFETLMLPLLQSFRLTE
jgi:pimeloyl-ACP methyl ester carboxylesterase